MTRRMLIAFDGSDPSIASLEHALEVFPEAELIAIHVVDELESHYGGGSGADGDVEPDFFETVTEIAAKYDTDINTCVINGTPASAIIEFADEESVDGIIVGSAGRSGVSRMLLGSVAENVARKASVPVTIVH
ncbi:universal stress protein [Saliphagus infecundisoli]|uniref:Universal stress protein n=1 Tax=Saliphagus infecundisoli TaxID=1849069 RepID=A0ABD5QAS9_9EURY|nr:universal stress protein [Saliphagus infecundisoli]